MGNRAYIVLKQKDQPVHPCIYLHWNGGPESVYRFVEYLTAVARPNDPDYAAARLVQLIGNYFGGNTSLDLSAVATSGISELHEVGDNGAFVVGWDDKTKSYTVLERYRGSAKKMTAAAMAKEKAEALKEYQSLFTELAVRNDLHFKGDNNVDTAKLWDAINSVAQPHLVIARQAAE